MEKQQYDCKYPNLNKNNALLIPLENKMKTTSITQEHRNYLDNLRATGAINMFEAPKYLMQEFGLDQREANTIFIAWMRSA